MSIPIESRIEHGNNDWIAFEWNIFGQEISGVYRELSPMQNGVQKIRVAVRIPAGAENVFISLTNRKMIERRTHEAKTIDEECYTVSYWDPISATGRLIVFPRDLYQKSENEVSDAVHLLVNDFQIIGENGHVGDLR